MAIKNIITKNQIGIHEAGVNLSFEDSNILTIIGMNGSGKSLFLSRLAELISNYSTQENQYFRIDKILTEQDVITITSVLLQDPAFKDNSKKLKLIDNFKESMINVDNLSDKFFLDSWWSIHLNKIKTYFNAMKDELNDKVESQIELALSSSMSPLEFLRKIQSISKNESEKSFLNTIKLIYDDYEKGRVLLENRLGNIKIIYADLINDRSDVPFSGNLNMNYDNSTNTYKVSAASFQNNIILFNFLKNSSVKPNDFRKLTHEKICMLNESKSFHSSYGNWIKSFVSQELVFKIEFHPHNRNYGYYNNSNSVTYTIHIHDKRSKNEITWERLSSGTRILFQIMNKMSEINNQSIIILDEPETGMHPMLQLQFREYIEEIAQETCARFIIATHSMFLIRDGAETPGLYICERSGEKGSAKMKKAVDFKGVSNDIQLFEAIEYIPFGTNIKFSEKANVIVEGETDVLYLKKMAKLLDLNIPGDIQFIKSTSRPAGYSGMMKTKTILESQYDLKNIYISPDADVEKKDSKMWKEFKQLSQYFVPIGKSCLPIESLFCNDDIKKYTANSSKQKKINKANLFFRDAELNRLDSETVDNFKELFSKYK